MFSGIRVRLLLSFMTLIVVTIASIGAYALWFFHQHNTESLTASLRTQAHIAQHLLADPLRQPAAQAQVDGLVKMVAAETGLRITVVQPDGKVVADAWENPAVMENHLQRPEIADALNGGEGVSQRYSSTIGQNMLYVAVPIQSGERLLGTVRIAESLERIEAGFAKIRSAILLALLCAGLLAVALSYRLARMYTAPLETITQAARHLAAGHLDHRIHVRTGDEVEILAHTFNQLSSNLEDKIQQMNAETHKLSLILQHMANAVLVLDRFGNVLTANQSARDTFGITPLLIGHHNLEVVGNSTFDRTIQQCLSGQAPQNINLKLTIRNQRRFFQAFLAPLAVEDSSNTEIVAVFHDITALQELQERQADFVANASHELATPLTSITGFSESLLDGALESPDLARKFVSIIHAEAERMNRLVKDLLQLAKLNSQEYRSSLTTEQISLNQLANMVTEEFAPHFAKKAQQVDLQLSDLDPKVNANRDWLKQAVINLVDNASKYTPEKGTITLKSWTEGNRAFLSIHDTGIGIPAQDLPLIFDRFYRVDRSRVRGEGGTGLGLSLTKFITELFGGRIEVASTPDVGSTFTLSFPL